MSDGVNLQGVEEEVSGSLSTKDEEKHSDKSDSPWSEWEFIDKEGCIVGLTEGEQKPQEQYSLPDDGVSKEEHPDINLDVIPEDSMDSLLNKTAEKLENEDQKNEDVLTPEEQSNEKKSTEKSLIGKEQNLEIEEEQESELPEKTGQEIPEDPEQNTEIKDAQENKTDSKDSDEMDFAEKLPEDEEKNIEENLMDVVEKAVQDEVLNVEPEISCQNSSANSESSQQLEIQTASEKNDDSMEICDEEKDEKILDFNPEDIELPDSDDKDENQDSQKPDDIIPEDVEESLLKSSDDEDSIVESSKEEKTSEKKLENDADSKEEELKDVVVIEEDEPVEQEKSKEETSDEAEKPQALLSSEENVHTEQEKETASTSDKQIPDGQPEVESSADEEVIEIPEDEPLSQDHSEVKLQQEESKKEAIEEDTSKKDDSNTAETVPHTAKIGDIRESDVNEENSSMSVDFMESNDIPSDRGETGEDDSRPIDMEVDDLANAEWPVNNFPKEQLESEKKEQEISKRYDCINLQCLSKSKEFAPAQGFVVTFYSSKKRKKTQYVCRVCYESAMDKMTQYCNVLENHRPLFHYFPQHKEVVEITDSSEDSSPEDEVIQSFRRPMGERERELVENNLDAIITSTMQRVKITQQFEWTKNDLERRCNTLTEAHNDLIAEFTRIQKMADNMFKNLNQRERRATQNEPPIHIFTEFPALDDENGQTNYRLVREKTGQILPSTTPAQYRPSAPLSTAPPAAPQNTRVPEIQVGHMYYGMRTHLTKPWTYCEVVSKIQGGDSDNVRYKVKFARSPQYGVSPDDSAQEGILTGKQLAFAEPPTQSMVVGSRILAVYSAARRKHFYPGIIAEPVQRTNNFRYLVFFDDGYVQYVNPDDIRRICQVSENVWEDVHPGSMDFIKSYLQENQFQRAVAQVKIGQKIEVERDGKWVLMRVAKVDCSLILVYHSEYTEWIYSGSQRLLPIYRMKMDSRLSTGKKLQTRNEPYVSFRHVADDSQRAAEEQHAEQEKESTANRSVAKKSTAAAVAIPTPHQQVPQQQAPPQAKQLMNNSTIFLEDDDNRPKGKVVFYTAKFNMPPKSYTPHLCNSECLYRISYDLSLYNPLAKPLLSGWERKIYRVKTRRYVIYKAPCGRSLRDISEIHKYLRLTDCPLNVDSFDFEPAVHCLAEYVIESAIKRIADISNGVESMPIACVNCYDDTVPPSCVYANHRIPTEGVHLNLDPDFLVGCDCEDDCRDKSKCSCWQLTIAGVKYLSPGVDINTVGYSYMKLYDPVQTGIYECNSRCKCRKNCLNRVVQHPLSLKLQVFKTANRGWGLRCLNDVPRGQFICIYAGHLLTEQKANEGGQNHGDEYFAELDYIEVAEGMKEGFEPEAVEEESASDRDDDEYDPKRRRESDSDEEFRSNTAVLKKTIKTRSRTRGRGSEQTAKESQGGEGEDVIAISDDDDDRVPQSFVPNISIEKEVIPSTKNRSLRRMFGKNEDVYVMDAKIMGNVGRYFNHSCSPNLFVQNVFVDTHDLRFPWVSFFAICHIRAGTELTWNYNYDVGTVPGKFLFCQCGSKNCRGRIL